MSREYKIDELMGYEGLPETILSLRKKGRMSYDSISRWLFDNGGIDASSSTIYKLINNHLGGDPLGRIAWSKSGRPKKEGSIDDFEADIKKHAADGYNAKQIEKYLLLVKAYKLRPGELKEARDRWGIKITGGKGYVGTSPIDFDIVNGNYR